jgi:hypothetical protein
MIALRWESNQLNKTKNLLVSYAFSVSG